MRSSSQINSLIIESLMHTPIAEEHSISQITNAMNPNKSYMTENNL